MRQGQNKSEPSMEDILASIRKIIAEEPQSANAGAPVPPPPRPLPPESSKPARTAHSASALDRDIADLLAEPPPPAPGQRTPSTATSDPSRQPTTPHLGVPRSGVDANTRAPSPAPNSAPTTSSALPGLDEARRAAASDAPPQAVPKGAQEARNEPAYHVPSPSTAASLPRASAPSPLTSAHPGPRLTMNTGRSAATLQRNSEVQSAQPRQPPSDKRSTAEPRQDDPVQDLLGRLAGTNAAPIEPTPAAPEPAQPSTARLGPTTPVEIERPVASPGLEAQTSKSASAPAPHATAAPTAPLQSTTVRPSAQTPSAPSATSREPDSSLAARTGESSQFGPSAAATAAVQAATAAARSLGSPPEPSLPASIATAVTAAAAASLASSGGSARPTGLNAQAAPEGRSTVPSTTKSDEPGPAPAPDQKLGKSEASRPPTGIVEPVKLAPQNATTESSASASPSQSPPKSATPWIQGDAAGKSAPAESGDKAKNERLADAPAKVEPGKPQASDPQMLEDILADLLRPMVRKWLDENMTRALEKAVRIEVADGVLDVVSKLNSTTKS